MARSVKITLQGIPPSLNRFAGRENAREYRAEKKIWTEAVAWSLKAKGVRLSEPFQKAMVTITYYFPTAGRHDADNYAGKMLLDGLTQGGIIVDDDLKHITTTIAGDVDRRNPRTEITIVEV